MGAPESYTLDGPPEKIIPFGFSLIRFSKEKAYGTRSAYTEKSLIRQHIKRLYCEPISKTTI